MVIIILLDKLPAGAESLRLRLLPNAVTAAAACSEVVVYKTHPYG